MLKVSVVIPLYNREKLIPFTLDSLRPEFHPGVELEVIVVDDGSTDAGPELVKKLYPWVHLIENTVNKGAPVCRNIGLNAVSTKYVLFLDSDDLVENDFFKERLSKLIVWDVVGIYGPWDYFESEDLFNEQLIRPRHSKYLIYYEPVVTSVVENLLGGWYIPSPAILWNTTALKSINGFDESLKVNQDVDLLFRALQLGMTCGVDKGRALIRIHRGERIGEINSREKLSQIFQLRKRFVNQLIAAGNFSDVCRERAARYLFNLWAVYRKLYPDETKQILVYSKSLYSHLVLEGSWPLRMLGRVVGNKYAIAIKQLLRGTK